jgi:hypothetical protein
VEDGSSDDGDELDFYDALDRIQDKSFFISANDISNPGSKDQSFENTSNELYMTSRQSPNESNEDNSDSSMTTALSPDRKVSNQMAVDEESKTSNQL